MNPQKARFFIIFVHYGSSAPTETLLASLQTQTVTAQQIIVIDHAKHALKQNNTNSAVSVFRPPHNAGYSGGINMALGMLLSQNLKLDDVVIVLNNDVILGETWLEEIDTWWKRQPEVGLVGSVLKYVNPWTGRSNQSNGLAYIDGSFIAASYTTWMRLKGLPDNYFLYWEDVALSFQAVRKGLILQTIPHLALQHEYSQQLSSEQKLFYLIRNGAVCLETETRGFLKLYWFIVNRLRYLYHLYISLRPESKLTAKALRAAITGHMGVL